MVIVVSVVIDCRGESLVCLFVCLTISSQSCGDCCFCCYRLSWGIFGLFVCLFVCLTISSQSCGDCCFCCYRLSWGIFGLFVCLFV